MIFVRKKAIFYPILSARITSLCHTEACRHSNIFNKKIHKEKSKFPYPVFLFSFYVKVCVSVLFVDCRAVSQMFHL